MNKEFERVTGYKIDEVLGKNPAILKSKLLPKEFYKELNETIHQGKTCKVNLLMLINMEILLTKKLLLLLF